MLFLFGWVTLLAGSARADSPSDGLATGVLSPQEARVSQVRVSLTVEPHASRDGGAAVHRNRAVARGRARYVLEAPRSTDSTLILLDFAAHLREEPRELDQIRLESYADGPWQGSFTNILQARVGRRMVAVAANEHGHFEIEVRSGEREVELEYEVIMPRRTWPFGCARGRCSLVGAGAPLPSARARGSARLGRHERVVAAARWHVEARFKAGARVPKSTARGEEWAQQERPFVSDTPLFSGGDLLYPMVTWGGPWLEAHELYRGVNIEVLSTVHRPQDRFPNETKGQLYPDAVGHVLALAKEAINVAAIAGIEPSAGTTLRVVHGPFRSAIAAGHPSVVFVSDRAFQVFPSKKVRKFHEAAVARAVLETVVGGFVTGRYDESTSLWVSGMLSYALTQAWQIRRENPDEFAEEILGRVSFMPAVDRFLYTSQAQFANSYFRGSEDPMPVRNDPRYFANTLPTGRRIHEKATDLMGLDAVSEFYRALITEPSASPRTLLERAYGYTLDWFFEQWLGPLVASDYGVKALESTPDGARFAHRLTIIKSTDRPVVEPLQIRVLLRSGEVVPLVWNGESAPDDPPAPETVEADGGLRVEHVFEFSTEAPVKSVLLDPKQRIVQTSRIATSRGGRTDNSDPRFNDLEPKRGRFVYTGIGINVAASEFASAKTPIARTNAVSAFLAFEASLRRDMRRTANFSIFTDRETIVGVGAAGNFFFLRPRNRQRRRLSLRVGGGASWLNRQGLDESRGVRIAQSISLLDNTTRFGWWPESGHVLELGVSSGQTFLDADPEPLRVTLGVGGGWVQYWRIAHEHVIATALRVGIVSPLVGQMQFRSLLRVGGIGGLAGFGANEVFGRGVARLQLEYRHLLLRHLSVNGLHVAWFRGLGGVVTGGVASSSSCAGLDGWFDRRSWYGTAGYAVQAQVQILGALPQLIRVEASVPFGRRTTECLGATLPDKIATSQGLPASSASSVLPPLSVNVTFNHPF